MRPIRHVLAAAAVLALGIALAGVPRGASADPAATIERYAADLEIVARSRPSPSAPAVRAFRIGDPIPTGDRVEGEGGPWFTWAPDGEVAGYVPAAQVADAAPVAAAELARAEAALAAGDLDGAVLAARRAVALDRNLRAAFALLAAAHEARGDRDDARVARIALARFPPPADEPLPADAAPPAVGERGYVAVAELPVRPSPDAGATLALPLGTEVEVLERVGALARVRWEGRITGLAVLRPGGDPRADGASGYLLAAGLATARPTLAALLAAADAAEARSDTAEAARRLEAAARLATIEPALPRDEVVALLGRLARVATRAARYEAAAWAAATARAFRGPAGVERVTPALYFGCAADPPVDPAAPPVECLAAAHDALGECPPCAPDPADDDAERERAAAEHARALEQHRRAREQAAAASRAAWPSGPWFHAIVHGDAQLHLADRRVFVYGVPFTCCPFELRPVELHGGDVRWPDAGETTEVWAAGGYGETLWGVIAASDPAEARAIVEAKLADGAVPERGIDGGGNHLTGPYLACGCFEAEDGTEREVRGP